MSWKWLRIFPLAALAVGTRVEVPELRAPIPEYSEEDCDYARGRELYLQAYAYSREDAGRAMGLLREASAELSLCGGEVAPLAGRIRELERSLAQIGE